jgi:uroporphyrin-III C-methyltransferase
VALAANLQQLLSFDGMSKLEEIIHFPKSESGETPVAIIQNGTTPREKVGWNNRHDSRGCGRE